VVQAEQLHVCTGIDECSSGVHALGAEQRAEDGGEQQPHPGESEVEAAEASVISNGEPRRKAGDG